MCHIAGALLVQAINWMSSGQTYMFSGVYSETLDQLLPNSSEYLNALSNNIVDIDKDEWTKSEVTVLNKNPHCSFSNLL